MKKFVVGFALAGVLSMVPGTAFARDIDPGAPQPSTDTIFYFCPPGAQLQLTTSIGMPPPGRSGIYDVYIDVYDVHTLMSNTSGFAYAGPEVTTRWYAPAEGIVGVPVNGPTKTSPNVAISSVVVVGWRLGDLPLIDRGGSGCIP